MKIRAATNADRDAIWKIFHEVVAVGDTYALDPHLSREEALGYWFEADTQTYVAEDAGRAVGTYICGLTSRVAARTLRMRHSWSLRRRVVTGSVARWANIV